MKILEHTVPATAKTLQVNWKYQQIMCQSFLVKVSKKFHAVKNALKIEFIFL